MIEKSSAAAITDFLSSHPHWKLRENKLFRHFLFKDFLAAFDFMKQVAIIVEQANHHPEWINIYNKVDIYLITHEVDGITSRDFKLADEIDSFYIISNTPNI